MFKKKLGVIMSFENWLQKKDTNMFYEFFVEAKKDKKWIQKLDIKKDKFTDRKTGNKKHRM